MKVDEIVCANLCIHVSYTARLKVSTNRIIPATQFFGRAKNTTRYRKSEPLNIVPNYRYY